MPSCVGNVHTIDLLTQVADESASLLAPSESQHSEVTLVGSPVELPEKHLVVH